MWRLSGELAVNCSTLLGGGWFQVLVWTQVSTALGDFVTLWLIRRCALGLLEASALGSKTSDPYGKVRYDGPAETLPHINHIHNM